VAQPAYGTAFAPPPGPRSLRGLGTFTATLFGCHVVLGVVVAGVAAWGVLSWSRVSGATADLQLASDQTALVLMAITWSLTLVTGIAFISWLYVAAVNVQREGARLRRSPGWAIAGWFVPVLSLWRPKQMVDDVWRASMPGVPVGIDLRQVPKSGMVVGWWAAYLLAQSLPTVGMFRALYAGLAPNLRAIRDGREPNVPVNMARLHETVALWSLWSAVLLVVAAGLAATIVVRVTGWQQQRASADPA
jgi:hypothetical protein